jgi:DNA-binding NtrC family response regulator
LKKRILMYGYDPKLLESRRLVLENCGYQVSPVTIRADIASLLDSTPFDLLMLCHSLTEADCERLIADTSKRQPRVKSLILTAGEPGCHSRMMSDVFDIFQGPAKLISTVHQLIHLEQPHLT